MAGDPIRVGDVVKLKSIGPKMTVARIWENASGETWTDCIWFKGEERHMGEFPLAGLERG